MMNKKFVFFPVTLLLLVTLSGVAWMTETHADFLSESALNKLGFAPADIVVFDLERIFTSFFVTTGPSVFALAFVMILITATWSENRVGSIKTAVTFFGVHILTLLIMSIIFLPLHWLDVSFGSLISLSRDVGPSAGYFGLLGLCVAGLNGRSKFMALIAIQTFLLIALMTETSTDVAREYSADIAHIIAFPLGYLFFSSKNSFRTKSLIPI